MELSVSLLRGLLSYARDHEVDPALVLRHGGIDEHLLEYERPPLELAALGEAVRTVGRLTHEPTLGLSLGASMPLQALGALGALLTHCASLRSALAESVQYLPFLVPMSRLRLLEEGDRAHLVFESPFQEPGQGRFAVELAFAIAVRVGRHYLGAGHVPSEVRFRHAGGALTEAYTRAFGCPVRFEAARNELVFPRAMLEARQPFPDEALWRLLKRRADDMLVQERARELLHERVRHVLRHEVDLGRVDPAAIARRLGVSPRSLRRRLGDEGHSLSAIADDVRRELALSELLNPEMPIKHIADRVGFSEVSAFHRAFKRWTGVTPARYRAEATQLAHAS